MRPLLSRRTDHHPVVAFLDNRVFPWVVTYVISRPHILLLLCLIFALENPSTPAVVMLMLGNYTNVVSASASAVVLRQQSTHHEEITERHDAHAGAFDQILQEIAAIRAHLGIPVEGPP